jgi:hypothetical protein
MIAGYVQKCIQAGIGVDALQGGLHKVKAGSITFHQG